MISLFRPKLPIDSDELEWLLATLKWLIGEFGGVAEAPLVLPTADWFPATSASGDDRDNLPHALLVPRGHHSPGLIPAPPSPHAPKYG